MNLAYASLSVRTNSESSFLYCGGPVKLFYVCLSGWSVRLSGGLRYREACSCLLEFQDGWKKHFLPLLKSCEACAHLFECRDRP